MAPRYGCRSDTAAPVAASSIRTVNGPVSPAFTRDASMLTRTPSTVFASTSIAGAAGGAWWGLFVGLLLGIFSEDSGDWIWSVLTGLLIGLFFGALFGGMGYAAEFHVERYFREAIATRLAPVSRELILCYLAERVLGLPKSY